MKLKEAPETKSRLIGNILLHRSKYKVDKEYQREKGTWRKEDEQYFIDTILRGLGMPPIFLDKKKNVYYIVDGQQRFDTILKFKDNKLEISNKYSGDIIENLKIKRRKSKDTFRYGDLDSEWRDRFDNYPLPVTELEDYSDEEIRDLFRRLQHGKPLVAGEILNAYAGKIVRDMRELARHKFFTDITPAKYKRYKHYYLMAILIYLEFEGINEVKPKRIYDFFEKNKTIKPKALQKIKRRLNFMTEIFQTKTPELRKPTWIITLYLLISYLLDNYVIENKKRDIKTFFTKFYKNVADAAQTHDNELEKFYNALSAKTNDRATIQLRHDTILKRFLDKYNPVRLDENRLFSNNQKIEIFRRDQEKCQICGKKLIFGNSETQFHHKDKYVEGGRTESDKGLLVCRNCHLNKIHSGQDK